MIETSIATNGSNRFDPADLRQVSDQPWHRAFCRDKAPILTLPKTIRARKSVRFDPRLRSQRINDLPVEVETVVGVENVDKNVKILMSN